MPDDKALPLADASPQRAGVGIRIDRLLPGADRPQGDGRNGERQGLYEHDVRGAEEGDEEAGEREVAVACADDRGEPGIHAQRAPEATALPQHDRARVAVPRPVAALLGDVGGDREPGCREGVVERGGEVRPPDTGPSSRSARRGTRPPRGRRSSAYPMPTSDTPLPAKSTSHAPTSSSPALLAWQKPERQQQRQRRIDWFCNELVHNSVKLAGKHLQPWKGNTAIDATFVPVAGKAGKTKARKPGCSYWEIRTTNSDAGWY